MHADAALIRACSPLSAMQPHSPGPCGKPMGLATGWRPGAGLHSALVLGGTPSFALCCFRALHKQQLGEGPSIPEHMATWASSDSLNCSASRDTAQGHVPHTAAGAPQAGLAPPFPSPLTGAHSSPYKTPFALGGCCFVLFFCFSFFACGHFEERKLKNEFKSTPLFSLNQPEKGIRPPLQFATSVLFMHCFIAKNFIKRCYVTSHCITYSACFHNQEPT